MTIYLILWAISGLFVPLIIAPEDKCQLDSNTVLK